MPLSSLNSSAPKTKATMMFSGVQVPAARARPISSVARNAQTLPAVHTRPPASGSQNSFQPSVIWPALPPTTSASAANTRLPAVA